MPESHGVLRIRRQCTECNQSFVVFANEPANRLFEAELVSKWMPINGKMYKLTWYDCPSCGKRFFVQCDDKHTEFVLKKIEETMKALNDKSTHRFDNIKRQKQSINKKRKDLARSRKVIEDAISGYKFIDRESGNEYEIEFYHE